MFCSIQWSLIQYAASLLSNYNQLLNSHLVCNRKAEQLIFYQPFQNKLMHTKRKKKITVSYISSALKGLSFIFFFPVKKTSWDYYLSNSFLKKTQNSNFLPDCRFYVYTGLECSQALTTSAVLLAISIVTRCLLCSIVFKSLSLLSKNLLCSSHLSWKSDITTYLYGVPDYSAMKSKNTRSSESSVVIRSRNVPLSKPQQKQPSVLHITVKQWVP